MTKNKTRTKKITVKPRVTRGKQKSELTRLGSALRALGGLGGGALGGLIGMPGAGSSFGTGLGASISKWLGSGDYGVDVNSIVTSSQRMSGHVPDMHKSDQSIIVRHKELVTTINSSQSFQVQGSYEINPGNPALFPWLSGVAARFQEYKIRGMVYHYVPTSGSAVASTNAALGVVMLQTSYRASDSPPVSKLEMMNEYNSNESVPCDAFCHPVECDPKENPFNIQYVRSSSTASVEDKLLYDLGTTHVAVQGCQTDGNPIGDLWCTYEIELKKPIVASNITSPYQTFGALVTSPLSGSSLLTGSAVATTGRLECGLSGNTLTFPKGRLGIYQVTLRLSGALTTVSWPNTVVLTACDLITGVPGFAQLVTVKGGTTDSIDGTTKILWVQLTKPDQQASILFPNSTGVGTITASVLTVTLHQPF